MEGLTLRPRVGPKPPGVDGRPAAIDPNNSDLSTGGCCHINATSLGRASVRGLDHLMADNWMADNWMADNWMAEWIHRHQAAGRQPLSIEQLDEHLRLMCLGRMCLGRMCLGRRGIV